MTREAVLTALFCARVAAAATYPLTGTVNGPDGPLPGARIQISTSSATQSTVTDSEGKFSIEAPSGNVTLRISGPAGSGLADDFLQNLDTSEALDGKFTLARAVTLRGRCSPGDPSTPGLEVYVYSTTTFRSYQVIPTTFASGIQVVPDIYSVHCRSTAGGFFAGRQNVDARSTDITNIDIVVDKDPPVLTKLPPRASLITIGAPDDLGVATVSGAAGAAEPLSSVLVANLQTQQVALVASNADGSFIAQMFAPPGSFVEVKHDPTGSYLPQFEFNGTESGLAAPPGTILWVAPATGFATGGIMNYYDSLRGASDFWRAPRFGVVDPGQWWITGTIDKTSLSPGDNFTGRGKLTLYSRNIDASVVGSVQVLLFPQFARLFDPQGRAFQTNHQFSSSMLTPTGLPIEESGSGTGVGTVLFSGVKVAGPSRIEADWTLSGSTPANLPPGLYRTAVSARFTGVPLQKRYRDAFPSVESGGVPGAAMPMVRVGTPAAKQHLNWVLGLDEIVNGTRGGIAVEDRGKFNLASHVMTATDLQILPRVDARTGQPIRYRLEPYLPMISWSSARLANPPQIPFRFPSGSLSVRVIKPDGSVDDLGSAPFLQSTGRTPLTRSGLFISNASASVTEFYQLTTLEPRFDYEFKQYGRHRVVMTGTIEDVFGNTYDGGGTYEVDVARPLDLEFGVMPGTPFEVTNTFAPSLIVQPPVPADIEIKLVLLPNSDPTKTITRTVIGRANRFGVFAPVGQTLAMATPGEYRVDITARYVDTAGTMWSGAATWGSVVATPSSRIVTKGRRGFDGVSTVQQQWLRVRESRAGGDHLMFPFHAGDVMWMQKDDPAADIPQISLQDGDGTFAARVRARTPYPMTQTDPPGVDERVATGEIPLFSSSATSISPAHDPDGVDQWGYFYSAAERPGVHVREIISGDKNQNGYWRFSDNYHFQLGNGTGGDLPNDFKFQFGGAVWREPKNNFFYYGAYASLFVLLPFNDAVGGRIFPPFQGNGGAPSGGPLFTFKGKPIDIFFHPTGIRPGMILQYGENASFTGYSAPTLPSKVEIVVTSPSGTQRTITGQASNIGYFADPSQDFRVLETGLWKAKVKITFDGRTSAGPVEPPYPTGDVLGSREGEFYFYVVTADSPAPAVEVRSPFGPATNGSLVSPSSVPITFTVTAPSGLTNVQMTRTTVMPGFILEEATGAGLTYVYNAQQLARDYPNLDQFDGDGTNGSDTITISFLVSGTDSKGTRKHFARQIVIQGEELQMPEQKETAIPSRRRAVRL